MVGILWNRLVFRFANLSSAFNVNNLHRILSQKVFCRFHDANAWFRRKTVNSCGFLLNPHNFVKSSYVFLLNFTVY